MSLPLLGEVRRFAGNFAPRGWAFCNGQLLPISENDALFSLLGTTYGGDGQVTFGLPDLRGRTPIHPGQGPGISSISLGQMGGTEYETLGENQIPSHSHGIRASTKDPDTTKPKAAVYAAGGKYGTVSDANADPSGNRGSNLPHNNRDPYLAVNFIIALEGIFPSQS